MLKNKNVKVFGDELFGAVRACFENGKILLAANDVANALGYRNPSKAVSDYCKYAAKRSIPHSQSSSKELEMLFIPEGDVYRIIMRSELSSVQKFVSWVFDELLPSECVINI